MELSPEEIQAFKDLKPERIVLSDAAFDKLNEIIEAPAKPNPALVELMKRRPSWAKS